MIYDVLFPLADIEEGLEELFDDIDAKGFMEEDAPDANWNIHLHENILTITISHGPDVTENVKAVYN